MSWAAAIGAGASLLGGIFDRNQRNKEMRVTEPAAIRRKAEAAGFNPLLFTNQAFQMPAGAPSMGASIADAASMYLGERGREQQLELQRAELEMANERLTNLAEQARLRPTYPGPYQVGASRGANPVNPSRRVANGATDRENDPRSDDVSGLPGATLDSIDGDRDGMIMPNSSGPGLTEISNDILPTPIVVPGSDGEPWGIDEVLTAVITGAPQVVVRGAQEFGDHVRDTQPYRDRLNERVQRERDQSRLRVNSEIEDMNEADDEWIRRRHGVYTGTNGAGGSW